jgi:cystathionine gamma-synthase
VTSFETLAIHAGQEPDAATGSVVTPIYAVSTYKQDGVGGLRSGYEYSRTGNPTRAALEHCIAALEGGRRGFAFSSGMAAEDCLLRVLCKPGDHVVIPGDAYGGTFRLVSKVLEPWGLRWSAVDQTDLDAVRAAMTAETAVLWCETPTNPLLRVTDIAALGGIAHEYDARLVVDNTFASPYLQQPLAFGADVVVHSTTKYMGGHSDVIGGAVVVQDSALAEQIGFQQNAVGAVAGPFDAWLVLRGIKTLAVRMDRHCDNAERITAMLESHDRVKAVHYPVKHAQMKRRGGMVSFRIDNALDVVGRTKIFTLAESLGGVESLIEHPGRMTHASVAGSALEVPDDLIRLSVGIENVDDLIADLTAALG